MCVVKTMYWNSRRTNSVVYDCCQIKIISLVLDCLQRLVLKLFSVFIIKFLFSLLQPIVFLTEIHLLEETEMRVALLGLVDIMFAYAYNNRVTEGENTVESTWTIRKLSSTLSWFDVSTFFIADAVL
jgi:hypothetical protein